MEASEIDLVEKSQQGNIEAFEKLISFYQKKVFNIAFRMMGNQDDASDVAQEVFIKIYKSIGSFKKQSAFSTWVYKITINTCRDELRKQKNKRNTISLDQSICLEDNEVERQIQSNDPTPELVAEKRETGKLIKEAIFNLSDEYKEVVILRDIQGFSYSDIAKILNCPEGTVKSRINRARSMLKDILKGKMELWDRNSVK